MCETLAGQGTPEGNSREKVLNLYVETKHGNLLNFTTGSASESSMILHFF